MLGKKRMQKGKEKRNKTKKNRQNKYAINSNVAKGKTLQKENDEETNLAINHQRHIHRTGPE